MDHGATDMLNLLSNLLDCQSSELVDVLQRLKTKMNENNLNILLENVVKAMATKMRSLLLVRKNPEMFTGDICQKMIAMQVSIWERDLNYRRIKPEFYSEYFYSFMIFTNMMVSELSPLSFKKIYLEEYLLLLHHFWRRVDEFEFHIRIDSEQSCLFIYQMLAYICNFHPTIVPEVTEKYRNQLCETLNEKSNKIYLLTMIRQMMKWLNSSTEWNSLLAGTFASVICCFHQTINEKVKLECIKCFCYFFSKIPTDKTNIDHEWSVDGWRSSCDTSLLVIENYLTVNILNEIPVKLVRDELSGKLLSGAAYLVFVTNNCSIMSRFLQIIMLTKLNENDRKKLEKEKTNKKFFDIYTSHVKKIMNEIEKYIISIKEIIYSNFADELLVRLCKLEGVLYLMTLDSDEIFEINFKSIQEIIVKNFIYFLFRMSEIENDQQIISFINRNIDETRNDELFEEYSDGNENRWIEMNLRIFSKFRKRVVMKVREMFLMILEKMSGDMFRELFDGIAEHSMIYGQLNKSHNLTEDGMKYLLLNWMMEFEMKRLETYENGKLRLSLEQLSMIGNNLMAIINDTHLPFMQINREKIHLVFNGTLIQETTLHELERRTTSILHLYFHGMYLIEKLINLEREMEIDKSNDVQLLYGLLNLSEMNVYNGLVFISICQPLIQQSAMTYLYELMKIHQSDMDNVKNHGFKLMTFICSYSNPIANHSQRFLRSLQMYLINEWNCRNDDDEIPENYIKWKQLSKESNAIRSLFSMRSLSLLLINYTSCVIKFNSSHEKQNEKLNEIIISINTIINSVVELLSDIFSLKYHSILITQSIDTIAYCVRAISIYHEFWKNSKNDQQPSNDDPVIEEVNDENPDNQKVQDTEKLMNDFIESLVIEVREYSKEKNSVTKIETKENLDEKDFKTIENSEPNPIDKDEIVPLHLCVIETILKFTGNIVNELSTRDKLKFLRIAKKSIPLLGEYTDLIYPYSHCLWESLISKLSINYSQVNSTQTNSLAAAKVQNLLIMKSVNENEIIKLDENTNQPETVVRQTFDVLCTLVESAGGFMESKLFDKRIGLPSLMKWMVDSSFHSLNVTDDGCYRYTSTFKLQLKILQKLPSLLTNMCERRESHIKASRLTDNKICCILKGIVLYLNNKQPIEFQFAAGEIIKFLSAQKYDLAIFYQILIFQKMPLPPKLANRLKVRGILPNDPPSLPTDYEEEIIAEDYTSNKPTPNNPDNVPYLLMLPKCPNAQIHECTSNCAVQWSMFKFQPKETVSKIQQLYRIKYPLTDDWREVPDPKTSRIFYWNINDNKVSWLPPAHPKHVTITPPSKSLFVLSFMESDPTYKNDKNHLDDIHRNKMSRISINFNTNYKPNTTSIIKKEDEQPKRKVREKRPQVDPLDPSSYSDIPIGTWESGLNKF
ncbi:hypothetical protein SNEBB_005256 [Seison nebaliae]|nr:hypothetical protein SNEBB_005256 [Seison nebaliae]